MLRLAEQIVLASLAGTESATRAELSELTDLPRTTVIAATNSLVARGLLEEELDPPDGKRAGRPSTRLVLTLGDRRVALVELGRLGGTTVSIGDCRGNVRGSTTIDVNWSSSIEDVASQVRSALDALTDRPIDAVVLSLPAPFEPGFGIRVPRVPVRESSERTGGPGLIADWLRGDPSPGLAAALGMPVATENDANLAALGEARFGAGRDAGSTVHLSVKSGFGSGITINGQLFRGATGMAGEVTHVAIEKDGRLCMCGNRGCLMTVIADRPLPSDQVSQAYEHPVTMTDVIRLAASNDIGVHRVLSDYGRLAGEALAGFVALFVPQQITVDGSLGPASQAVVEGIIETLRLRVQPTVSSGIIVRAGELEEGAQLMGAVAMLRDRRMRELARSVWPASARWVEPAAAKDSAGLAQGL